MSALMQDMIPLDRYTASYVSVPKDWYCNTMNGLSFHFVQSATCLPYVTPV